MNTKLLRKIKAHILEEPKRYDQNLTVRIASDYLDKDRRALAFPECGTTACIGGWALILTGTKPEEIRTLGDPLFTNAKKILRITGEQAGRLMSFHTRWPKRFARAYQRARSRATRAAIAAKRIDHFIKTKGAE